MDQNMDPNINSSMDPSNGAHNSVGDQVQQTIVQILNDIRFGDNHTKGVQVMPCQVQMLAKCDNQGHRYMVLENLPIDKNYLASHINSGFEFA